MKIKQQSKVTNALVSSLLVATSTNLIADETEVISVTANRIAQSIQESLTAVEVIDRVAIEKIQATSTVDLLKSVAGLDFSFQGGLGQQSSIFVRGANSNHTLILVDGLRVGSATLGTTEIQNISPSQIERIEIVKGPRAAIWGSDAIGGVIQIFTRKGDDTGYTLGAKVGSDNYRQLDASAAVAHGEGASTFTLNHQSADGFDVLDAGESQADDDGFDLLTASVNGEQAVSEALTLNWALNVNQKDAEYDTAWGGADKVQTDNYSWLLGGAYATLFGGKSNTTSFSFGQSQDKSQNYETGQPVSSGTEFKTERGQFSVVNSTALSANTTLNLGTDYINESVESTTDYVVDARSTLGVFSQLGWAADAVSVEAALRYDDVEGIASETSYNLAAGYQVLPSTKVLVSHGTGFKAPTFNDLYFPFGGNDQLDAEYSSNSEIAVRYQGLQLSVEANVYQSKVENLIRWVADENFNYQPENVDSVDISGAEFKVSYRGEYINQQVSVAHNEALDNATDEQLIRRPQQHFSYAIDAQFGAVGLYGEYILKGKSYDLGYDESFQQVRMTLPSYSLVNLSASYPVTERLTANLRLSNVLDETYHTALNYNTPQTQWYLGVTYRD